MKKELFIAMLFFCTAFLACTDKPMSNTIPLNYDSLPKLRIQIQNRLDTAIVGITDGTYPQSSYDGLLKALDELKLGISKANAGVFILQFEIDNYMLAAQKAIKLFDESKLLSLPVNTPAELFINGIDHKGYIDFGSSPEYCGGAHFTVETWTKYNDGFIETTFGSFISTFISPLPYKGWTLHYWGTANSLARFSFGTDNANPDLTLPTIYTAAPTVYDKWFHIAAVFDVTSKKALLYINGELKASAGVADNMVTNSANDTRMWAFVEPKDNSRCMSGYIKKFRLWSTSKSESEIKALMNADVTGNENGLICAWDFVKTPVDSKAILDKTGKHTAKIVGVYKWKPI
jgi:Concanavalin A-like lectin/glucanases superfamily